MTMCMIMFNCYVKEENENEREIGNWSRNKEIN
jgi:hypothetical protein